MIVSTPNDRSCKSIVREMDENNPCEAVCNYHRGNSYSMEKCLENCKFKRSRYSEDCYNEDYTQNLIA